MALRLLQNHLRDVEQRIGPARYFDLPGQGFDAFVVRDKTDIDLNQRGGRRRTSFLLLAPAESRSFTGEGFSARGWRASRTAGITARTIFVPARARRTVSPGRPGTTAVVPAIPAMLAAFKFGVLL